MYDNDLEEDYTTQDTPKKCRFSDVKVTQVILCIAILLTILILNIVKPEVSYSIVNKFKEYTQYSTKDTLLHIITYLNDRV